EIGIRKALGARKRDISNQFLAEAVGLSLIGSLLGMILGMLMVQIALPLIKKVIKAPFGIVYNPSTLLIIFILALLIGIIFGTYPALRAARLTPVDAIRHE
ncbi:MAG TPA: FtsX-like permease family protein, partial [Saprospiraceae bacterium]|nr:FtsX-like permease family protein [Saprospiraceae bacterium]